MAKTKGRIDITQIDESRLPKRNRVEDLQKIWYKFSLSKVSVVGLAIVMLVVLAAIFYKLIVPYPEDVGAVVNFQAANQPPSLAHIMDRPHRARYL